MAFVVYDTAALIAAEKNNRRFMAEHADRLSRGDQPIVPAGVLAQAWNPRPAAVNLHRVLRGCSVRSLTEQAAKIVAGLCHAARSRDVVDGSVVFVAIACGDAPILTGDVEDITALVAASGHRIRVERPTPGRP